MLRSSQSSSSLHASSDYSPSSLGDYEPFNPQPDQGFLRPPRRQSSSLSRSVTWNTQNDLPGPGEGTAALKVKRSTTSGVSDSSEPVTKPSRPKPRRHHSDSKHGKTAGTDRSMRKDVRRSSTPATVEENAIIEEELGISDGGKLRRIDSVGSQGASGASSEGKASTQKESIVSYRTTISRKILHGLPDLRMLDFARGVTKTVKDDRSENGAEHKHNADASLAVSLVEWHTVEHVPSTSTSSRLSTARVGNGSPHIRHQESENTSERHDSRWVHSERRSSSSLAGMENTHSKPSSQSSLSGPNSGDETRHSDKITTLLPHLSRPRVMRFGSHGPPSPSGHRIADKFHRSRVATPGSSHDRSVSSVAVRIPNKDPQSSASSPVLIANRPYSPVVPAEPLSIPLSPAGDDITLKRKYPRQWFKSLAGLLSPGIRAEPETVEASSQNKNRASRSMGDYFSQSSNEPTPSELLPSDPTAREAAEATRAPTPPQPEQQHRKRKSDAENYFDSMTPESSPDAAASSASDGQRASALEDIREVDGPLQSILRHAGPLSDSTLVQHRTVSIHGEDSWFRQRIDAIIGDDTEENYSTFEWDIPLHLPSSPLCPLHPKHKSGGKGVCVYHGRSGTQSTADASSAWV